MKTTLPTALMASCLLATPIAFSQNMAKSEMMTTTSFTSAHSSAFKAALKLKQQQQLPEAELAFKSIITKQGNHVKAFEQLAIVQSWQNKFELAIKSFQRALAIDANYHPARIGLARVSYWHQRRDIALTEINTVLSHQPENVDNWILKGDILLADKQFSAARTAYLQAKSLLGTNMRASLTKKIEAAVAPPRWRLDSGYIADDYTAHRVDGHSSYLQLGYRLENNSTVYARAEEYFSFDSTDTGIVLGGYFSPMKSVLVNAEVYHTNGEVGFRPNQQFLVNIDYSLNESWVPLLGYKIANYNVIPTGGANNDNGNVTTFTPGLRYIYENISLEFKHARTRNLDQETTSTNTLLLKGTFQQFSPYVFITQGEEGIPPLAVVDIATAGLGLVYKINNRISIRVDYSREDRKDTYIHNSIGAGLSWFF